MRRAAIWVVVLGLSGAGQALAQNPLPFDVPRSSLPLQLRGSMGTVSELYSVSGIVARRPWGMQRLYFNPTVTLFGSVDLTANLLVSTESGSTVGLGGLPGRQNQNEFGLHPSWAWGRGHLGTFTETYTKRTFNGIRVRGADVEINPGLLRFGVFGGGVARPVFGGLATGSYKRSIVGGRLGIGRGTGGQETSFLEVMLLRAWDDPNSLPSPEDATAPELPTIIGTSPFAVTPQENVVAGVVAGLEFLGGTLAWRGEIDAALHSRDRRASRLADEELDGYPGIARGLMTPRVGSHGDVAYSTSLRVNLRRLPGATRASPRSLSAEVGYEFVGSGYVSLGTPYLLNDLRKTSLQTTVRMGTKRLRLDAWRQSDNVGGQKLSTTNRYRIAGMYAMQATRRWNLSVNASLLDMRNGAAAERRVAYVNWSLGTSQVFTISRRGPVSSLTATYSYRQSDDDNMLRVGSDLRAHKADARVAVRVSERVRLTPSLGLLYSRFGANNWTTRATYGLAGRWQSSGKRLTISGNVSTVRFSTGDAFRVTGRARYRLTTNDAVELVVRGNDQRSDLMVGRSFSEFTTTLKWSRRL